jgi:hypothetical protein
MTPEEHLAMADDLLAAAVKATPATAGPWVQSNVHAAIAHALIAMAVEAGVPHQAQAAGGGESGVVPAT